MVRRAPTYRGVSTAARLTEAVDRGARRYREHDAAQDQRRWPKALGALALPVALDGRAEAGQPQQRAARCKERVGDGCCGR
jgi:hypothetical protein